MHTPTLKLTIIVDPLTNQSINCPYLNTHGNQLIECEQRGLRAVTSDNLRERSGNGGSNGAQQEQEHGTRKKARRAAQQSGVDGVGMGAVDAMYGTAAEAHGPAVELLNVKMAP